MRLKIKPAKKRRHLPDFPIAARRPVTSSHVSRASPSHMHRDSTDSCCQRFRDQPEAVLPTSDARRGRYSVSP